MSKLIAYLWVCGHYHRLYTIDAQVQHSDKESLYNLGKWLAHKWQLCENKYQGAQAGYMASGHTPAYLQAQWSEQVKSHTKPLPPRSQTAGKRAVEEALRLRKSCEVLAARLRDLENVLADVEAQEYESVDVSFDIEDTKKRLRKVTQELRMKEKVLGVEGKKELCHLVNSLFLNLLVNAHALKMRLRKKLRARKFERDRFKRSFHTNQGGEHKLHAHLEDSIQRRDPVIQHLLRNYNTLCQQMADLEKKKRVPKNAILPMPISAKELFSLDVNDAIWQDLEVNYDQEGTPPPPWLADEKVRRGIQEILLLDRCDEEFIRLEHECYVMREWFAEEWQVLTDTISVLSNAAQPDLDLLFQLNIEKHKLCKLCVRWRTALLSLSLSAQLEQSMPWGLSKEELDEAQRLLAVNQLDIVDSSPGHWVEAEESSDEEGDLFDFEDDADLGMVEQLDALYITDSRELLEDSDT